MPSFSAKSRPLVVLVTFPNAKLLDVAGPMQVFTDAKRCGGKDYEFVIVSVDGGDQDTDTKVKLPSDHIDVWRDKPIHTLLIAGGLGARPAAKNAMLIAKVRDLARRAKRVASICTGGIHLGGHGPPGRLSCRHALGILRGSREMHPEVKIDPDRIFIRQDRVWTSAGVTAGIDMALGDGCRRLRTQGCSQSGTSDGCLYGAPGEAKHSLAQYYRVRSMTLPGGLMNFMLGFPTIWTRS